MFGCRVVAGDIHSSYKGIKKDKRTIAAKFLLYSYFGLFKEPLSTANRPPDLIGSG
jgi:hypothetical protein